MVNPGAVNEEVTLNFKDFLRKGRIERQVLTSTSGNDENIMQNPLNVKPVTSTFTPAGDDSHALFYSLPRYSLVILRIPVTDVAAPVPADDDGWQDITSQLANPDFAKGGAGWSGSTFSAAPGTVAEFFNTNFNTYQALRNMPAGHYRLTIDGFYRAGSISRATAAHADGTESLNAELYITADKQTVATPLFSLYDEHAPYVLTPSYTYPDSVTAANIAFNFKAAYRANTVETILPTEGGTLRLGLRKTQAVASDWTCIDNAHLYYRRGDIDTGIEEIQKEELRMTKTGIYDLQGRSVSVSSPSASSVLPKGFYIVNGKKVIIK